MSRLLAALLLIAASIPLAAASPPTPGIPAAEPLQLVLTDADSLGELREIVRSLEKEGASLRHLFPPGAAMGRVPPGLDPDGLPGLAGRVAVLRDPQATAVGRLAGSRPDLMGAWRRLARPAPPMPDDAAPAPLINDALPPPDEEGVDSLLHAGDCSNNRGTSLYLVGDVAIGIVMPESNTDSPDTEEWDPARQDAVVAEIVQGCSVLADQVLPWAGLDFVYDVQRSVPVGVEPILMPSSQAGVWAREAVQALGHSSARAYVEHMIEAQGTDWGVVAFVADDLNDPDNRFADGSRFAFAYLGGPSIWMTYDNDGWGINRMDTVFIHEMGHSFRALDEYASSDPRCEARGGVLGIENQNADVGCLSDVPCIMRGNGMTSGSAGSDPAAALMAGHCEWTQGQMGAWDLDLDNLADLRDVPPQSGLDHVLPSPVETADLTVTGRATAKAEAGEVGEDRYPGHTLNRISRVEYRLDGGAWTEATGVWGELCAEFEVSLTGLEEGWHTVESRAVSLLCEPEDVEICDPPRERVEESLPEERFYVNTDCPDDAWEQNDLAWEAPWVASGTLAGLQLCAFDLDHYGVYLREGAALALRVDYADPAVPLELVLLDPARQEVLRSVGAGGTAQLSLPAAGSEGLWVALVLADGEFETAYELTVTAECIDDGLEPNGSAPQARELAPGSYVGLQICDGDEDWYVLGVGSGAEITAGLSHQAALGNLDLALFDGDLTLVAESATGADLEEVNGAGLAGGLYYLRVRGAAPDADNRYELTLAVVGCLDDVGENDDDRSQAGLLTDRVEGRRICAWDEDWYRVEVAEPSFLRVEALFVHDRGDLDLEIRGADGDLVGGSYRSTDTERIDLQRVVPGTYYVKVFAKDPVSSNPRYDLELLVADPVLLMVYKRDRDVLLDWSEVGVDCFQVLRNDRPDTWAGGLDVRTGLGDGGQEEAMEDPTWWEDLGAVDGTRLYFYRVYPGVCRGAELQASKTAEPYPVYGFRTQHLIFTVKVVNAGGSTISDITIRDDMNPLVANFGVMEFPDGATDLSSPTGGAFGRGYIEIGGFDLAPGETAVVRFFVYPDMNSTGGPNKLSHVLRNQARVTGFDGSLGGLLEALTDDPATIAYPDSTDVAIPSIWPGAGGPPLVAVFWNQDVRIVLRVEDPCGNWIGSEDASSAECGGAWGRVERFARCGEAWPYGWTERVAWDRADDLPSGDYHVYLRYAEDRDSGGDCLHTGPDDAVVTVETGSGLIPWEWLVLEPTDTDWQQVMTFSIP